MNTIAPRSPESKSFYQRGLECEKIAAQYFANKGFRVLFHKLSHQFGEIDLVLFSPQSEIILVEVKSCVGEMIWRDPVGRAQKQRLKRVLTSLLSENGILTPSKCFYLVSVDSQNEVQVFEDFLST